MTDLSTLVDFCLRSKKSRTLANVFLLAYFSEFVQKAIYILVFNTVNKKRHLCVIVWPFIFNNLYLHNRNQSSHLQCSK